MTSIHCCDIGAAAINGPAPYDSLINAGRNVKLTLFDGDKRQIQAIKNKYPEAVVYSDFVLNGRPATVYVTSPESGMTSLKRPNEDALKFFNGFTQFGKVNTRENVNTIRLNDLSDLNQIDFLKLDCQGTELEILKNATHKIRECLFIQLEVSFVPLYKNQPTIGEIDLWMKQNGFIPHTFLEIKKWSIAPTIKNNNFRLPFNQLLEADAVYMRNPLEIEKYSIHQLKKAAVIAHDIYKSPDLTIFFLIELKVRKAINQKEIDVFIQERELDFT